MTSTAAGHAEVRAAIAGESPLAHDGPAIVGRTQRLCRGAARTLPAMGVGVSLISEKGNQVTMAASDSRSERIEELEFTMGQGPGLDAYTSRRPVLVPNLAEAATTRWAGYAVEAQDHGVRAVFAFPLQIGASRLGALGVYRERTGELSATSLTLAFTFAEVAMGDLLDAQQHRADTVESAQGDAVDCRFEVYQAQGMLTVQLGVDLTEAMVRLRAYAYAHNRRLGEVADDIVAGKLILEPDGA